MMVLEVRNSDKYLNKRQADLEFCVTLYGSAYARRPWTPEYYVTCDRNGNSEDNEQSSPG